MSSDLVVTPLTASIGARVDGVDLRKVIDEETARQIREAFWEHQVLVFPDPDGLAGLEEQMRLAELFGEIRQLPTFTFLGDTKAYIGLDARRSHGEPDPRLLADGAGASRIPSYDHRSHEFEDWHTDSSFTAQLPRAATIRAEVIPPIGGDTGWINLCAAYEALSPVWQDWLAGLTAIHAVPPTYKSSINVWQYGEDAEARFDAEFVPREHPVVVQHPDTGRPALFVNPVYTVEIVGMTRQESNHLLRFLFTHITSARFVYRHHWSPGDIILWDEITCLHLAPDDFAPHPRKTVRVTAGLATPTAATRMTPPTTAWGPHLGDRAPMPQR